MSSLADIAPGFVEMAHRIVWCTAATVDPAGQPSTRVLHPIWEWDGTTLTGWIATSPQSPKRAHLDGTPALSLTYWHPSQDTCTADCDAEWKLDETSKRETWDRFLHGPEPVGYDPRLIPPWTDPTVEAFGVLELRPRWLRVMPGSLMTTGRGELQTWRR